MSNVHKTAQGAALDMESLRLKNETVIAVGNMRVNARGERVDGNGNVIESKSDTMRRAYKVNALEVDSIGTGEKHE